MAESIGKMLLTFIFALPGPFEDYSKLWSIQNGPYQSIGVGVDADRVRQLN